MPHIRTFPQGLPEHVWETLSRSVSVEPKIDSVRNSPAALKRLYHSHLAVVMMADGEAVGFIAAWPVQEGFLEIGSIWIEKSYRGRGLSHWLYTAVSGLKGVRAAKAFGVTTNPISVRAGARVGLKMVYDWSVPIPLSLTCGPCEFVAPADQSSCERRNVSCWLRVLDTSDD